jgi:hypothetical protein
MTCGRRSLAAVGVCLAIPEQMRPRSRTAVGVSLVFIVDFQPGARQAAAVIEDATALPTHHIVSLVRGLRNTRPIARAFRLLPEPVELVESGLAGQAPLHQEATHHRAGAANAGTTMHIHTSTRLQGVMDAIEDLGHVHPLAGCTVILDRFAQVLDAERELGVVGLDLARLGEVDETLDAGLHQALQPVAGRLPGGAARMLSGQHLTG